MCIGCGGSPDSKYFLTSSFWVQTLGWSFFLTTRRGFLFTRSDGQVECRVPEVEQGDEGEIAHSMAQWTQDQMRSSVSQLSTARCGKERDKAGGGAGKGAGGSGSGGYRLFRDRWQMAHRHVLDWS